MPCQGAIQKFDTNKQGIEQKFSISQKTNPKFCKHKLAKLDSSNKIGNQNFVQVHTQNK